MWRRRIATANISAAFADVGSVLSKHLLISAHVYFIITLWGKYNYDPYNKCLETSHNL